MKIGGLIMYCPLCKSEYREGFDYCTTCQCNLVEKIIEDKDGYVEELEEQVAFLVNVSHKNEANMIEEILASNGIKVSKKYREAGAYLNVYMGDSIYGVDIYVLESDYEAAKELIEIECETSVEDNNEECAQEEALYKHEVIRINKRRSMYAWIILLFFTPGILGIVVFLVLIIIDKILK
jgi:hypothetical protein